MLLPSRMMHYTSSNVIRLIFGKYILSFLPPSNFIALGNFMEILLLRRQQNCFHGVDLSCLRNAALKEYFRQPIVDTFDVRICLAKSVKHTVDFQTASEYDLHRIEIPLEFQILETGTIHGLAFWFDVCFEGSSQSIWLSTSPTEPLTHWYQVRS